MRTFFLTLIVLLSYSQGLSASSQKPINADCWHAASTQYAMNHCAKRDSDTAVSTLLKLQVALWKTPHLLAEQKKALPSLLSRWQHYRDAFCDMKTKGAKGGSIYPQAYASCLSEMTWQYIENLSPLLCEGGGMTGDCEATKAFQRTSSKGFSKK